MSETLESRKIYDLKVPELRSELEKRDLDKTGVKAILLERLQKALIEEGEDPENYVFDKFEFKNVNYNEKALSEKNSKSPSVEKILSPVNEKKLVTPTKTKGKPNIVGRRPGPKSKTCVPQVKIEKIGSSILRKKNDEVKQEQADSSNVIINLEDGKKLLLDTNNSDVIDSNEAEAKEINADKLNLKEVVDVTPCNENEIITENDGSKEENTQSFEKVETVVVPINNKNTENEKVKQKIDNLIILDIDKEVEDKEESIDNLEEYVEEKNINDNYLTRLKGNKVIPETIDDEDNIQDEELDHEIDEEEIKGSNDDFNQNSETEKSNQENNKDDNNEDSINLTIGEDDIKLFADEEDTNIEKEDEVIENRTDEEISLSKPRESRHPPVTANSSRATTGSIKSRRSATEKRTSVGDKPRSSHKEDKDNNSSVKPIISVNMPKDEKKEEEKQVKDKVEAGIKQSNDSKAPQTSNDIKKNNTSLVRNIWVSGLSSITKATDLKQLFSKYGKVVGAKVVTNAKTPGARCYGFVTLSSAEDANRSIEHLHKTELHGRVISVERAKRDNGYQQTAKSSDASKVNDNSETERKNKKPEEKKEKREEKREKRPEITINDDKKPDVPKERKRSLSKDKSQEVKRTKIVIERDDRRKDRSIKSKSTEHDRERLRELERERERLEREKRRQQEILNFTKMKAERERIKQKEQEKALREEERKRRIEKERQLEIERKQKEEAIRLEKERQKLRIERERIEKEKAELLRLERENQRLERERLQREKEELRRAQEKLEETKRQTLLKRPMPPSPPLPSKRHSSSTSRYDERKDSVRSSRVQPNTDYISQAAPPPPNITSSRHRYEQHSSDSRRTRPSPPPPPPPASRPKDSTVNMRYSAPQTTDHHYRSRDERPDRREESRRKESSSSSSRHVHSSYDSNKSSYGMSRNSDGNAWSSAPVKSSYNSLSSNSGSSNIVMNTRPDPWSNSNSNRDIETAVWQRPPQPPTDNRWNSASSNPSSMSMSGRSSSNNPLYVNNHQVLPNMNMNMSTNYSDNRFDSYKMSGMSRKY